MKISKNFKLTDDGSKSLVLSGNKIAKSPQLLSSFVSILALHPLLSQALLFDFDAQFNTMSSLTNPITTKDIKFALSISLLSSTLHWLLSEQKSGFEVF